MKLIVENKLDNKKLFFVEKQLLIDRVNITNLKYSEISDIETKNSQSEIYPLIICLNHTNKRQLSWNIRNYKLQNINQNENTNI